MMFPKVLGISSTKLSKPSIEFFLLPILEIADDDKEDGNSDALLGNSVLGISSAKLLKPSIELILLPILERVDDDKADGNIEALLVYGPGGIIEALLDIEGARETRRE